MPLLNYDILTHVIRQFSTYEALSVSTICKSIHSIVIRQVLSSVHLATLDEIDKFPDFILADPSKRMPLLRRISFDRYILTERANQFLETFSGEGFSLLPKLVSFLIQVLTQARHLQAIYLPSSRLFFSEFPAFGEAFISNESLIELSLHEPSHEVLQVVKDMRSKLRVLTLQYDDYRSAECYPSDFSWITTHQQLESLTLIMSRRTGEWDYSNKIQWPLLHSLKIRRSIPMEPFVSAFPNIRTLQMNWMDEGNTPKDSTTQWSYLDHVIVPPVADRGIWRIQCPIRWLEFLGPIHRDRNETGIFPKHAGVYEAIRCAAPAILSVSVYLQINPEFWEPFSRHSRDVKLLEITVYHGGDIPSIEKWIKKIPEWLGNLKVLCLCLRFEQWVSVAKQDWSSELGVAEKVRGIEDVLAASMTDLRFLAITTGPYVFKDVDVGLKEERTWWRVSCEESNNGGNGVAKSIPHGKGEQLRERLLGMDYKSLLSLRASDIELF